MEKQGKSIRSIATEWGCSHSYVVRFLKRAGLGPFPDGSYDGDEAARLRKRYTIVGRGQRRYERRQGRAVRRGVAALTCDACGALYRREMSMKLATPHPERFCCSDCEADVEQGLTAKQIRRRRDRGICNDNAARPSPRKYVPPPKQRDIRECVACGGKYDALERHTNTSRDPSRFCHEVCELDYLAGVDLGSVQQRLRLEAVLGGADEDELRSGAYLHMCAEDDL